MTRAVLVLLLLTPLSGCFTMADLLLWDQATAPRQELARVPIEGAVALRAGDRVEVAISYADGQSRGVRLLLDTRGHQALTPPWPPGDGEELRIHPEVGVPGLSLTGDTLRWTTDEGEVLVAVAVSRSKWVPAERRPGERARRVATGVLVAMALPLCAALDAVTWPLQLLGLWIWREAGGSLLFLG